MSDRLSYYLCRIRQAGLSGTVNKVWQRATPYIHWPLYALGIARQSAPQEQQDGLRQFGDLCREAFRHAQTSDPERKHRATARMHLALGPDFPVLGYGNLAKPKGTGWHRDALHGHSFAPKYFARCDFLAPDVATDVKIPWELSRLQWLVWLAEAAVDASPDELERLAARFTNCLDDWIESNPPGYGVNWACGMEVAIRATNIAIAAGVFAPMLSGEKLSRATAILQAHQSYLARFPEVSDVPGNHYLTDLMGEVVLSAALNGLASQSFEAELRKFVLAAEAQFEPDGCHIERATIYHRLTYDILALPFALALRADSPSARRLSEVVGRAGAFMAQIADDAGNLPVFGDQDSGFAAWFGERAQQVDGRICGAANASETDLYTFFAGLAQTSAFFPDCERESGTRSGFATISGEQFHSTLKTGPVGLEGRAPHDHDDALSLCVSWKNRRLIVDPGCHSYTLDPAIRRQTIVSSRHNALAPADRERHPPQTGSINATMRGAPTATITNWDPASMQGALARTDASKMEASRAVKITGGGIEIADSWSFDLAEEARILWLFDPVWSFREPTQECAIPDGGASLQLFCEDDVLDLRLEAPHGARLRCYLDRFSPDYGAFTDCPALEITFPAAIEGSARFHIGGTDITGQPSATINN